MRILNFSRFLAITVISKRITLTNISVNKVAKARMIIIIKLIRQTKSKPLMKIMTITTTVMRGKVTALRREERRRWNGGPDRTIVTRVT